MYTFLSAVTLTMRGSVSFFSSSIFSATGSRTSLPRWSMGVTTMKMMSSTSTTSMSGVTLMLLLGPLEEPPPIAMAGSLSRLQAAPLEGDVQSASDHVEQLVGRLRDVDRAPVDPG